MKLSTFTINVLKNYADINNSIVLQKGKLQSTMAPSKHVYSEVEIEEDIPCQVGISDLNKFLANISFLKNPDLTIDDTGILISDGKMNIQYYSKDPSTIITPPEEAKEILTMDDPDLSFDIENSTLTKLFQLGKLNRWPSFTIFGKDGKVWLKLHDRKNDTSNFANMELADYTGNDFEATIKAAHIELIPDDYLVEIKHDNYAKFTAKNNRIYYFVSFEI